ncbi:YiiX/YebB-like N1pC/P60 family cysteine hydrolase [Burkholderia cenocepacia]|uniref:YiiX/YebB-like N1pC/P60 family cysteine hydrolase n=1 Tax=Burkholderia cenocepacia TaxID=95486 RepID=UPI0007C6AF42|nr:YiiX/YebB-like N1pC/P60 family cysteine hydrolase [Burkholderia cenocepacia]
MNTDALGEVKFIVEFAALQEGDILLTAQTTGISKAVRVASKSDYSHAILYVGGGSYIHSDGDGVHAANIQRLLFETPEHCAVLRPKQDVSPIVIADAINFARNEVGKEYSVKAAIRTKIGGETRPNHDENRQFCSRLVAQAYESAGLKLVENSLYCFPHELAKSDALAVVPNCVRQAMPEELEMARSENPIARQAQIMNDILKQFRIVSKSDIQTFQQLAQFVFDNPHFDDDLTKIVEDSGFWDLWRYDMERNPWRYDGEIFWSTGIQKDRLAVGAEFERQEALKMIERYTLVRQSYALAFSHRPLKYFRREIELYETLITVHQKRVDACNFVLDKIANG